MIWRRKKGVKTLNLPQNLQPTMKQSKSVVAIRHECFVGNCPDKDRKHKINSSESQTMSARFPTLLNLVGKQTTKGLMIWILK